MGYHEATDIAKVLRTVRPGFVVEFDNPSINVDDPVSLTSVLHEVGVVPGLTVLSTFAMSVASNYPM